MESRTVPGLNVQWPWGSLIVSGKKCVETRSYPIPKHYLGRDLAIIETARPEGQSAVIGIVKLVECWRYESKNSWLEDRPKHLVLADDPQFGFDPSKPKWGWKVKIVKTFKEPQKAPSKKGIIYCKNVRVTY